MSFTRLTREIIYNRDKMRCFRCGNPAAQIHHRRPRGMGGTRRRNTDLPSNGIVLCGVGGTDGCHGWVESNRSDAYTQGYLVRQGEEPATVPVLYWGQTYYLLDDNGGKVMSPA